MPNRYNTLDSFPSLVSRKRKKQARKPKKITAELTAEEQMHGRMKINFGSYV